MAADPAGYRDPVSGYTYFASPSGNLLCGVIDDGSGRPLAGCQALSEVASLPQCSDPDSNGPMVSLTTAGRVTTGCANQGFFIPEPSKRRALPYGSTLRVGSFTFTSTRSGIRCTTDATGEGFTASRERFGATR